MKSIFIATSTFGENDKKPITELEKLGYKILFNPHKRKLKNSELKDILNNNEVIAVIAGLEEYNREILAKSKIKIISRLGSGLSNIDIETARKNNIKISNTADSPSEAVAELTVGMAIILSRRIHTMNHAMKESQWKREYGNLIRDKNMFIIGYGKIGKKVSRMMKYLGANIIIYDPFLKNKKIKTINFIKGLKKADIISIHSSSLNQILGEKEFSILKKGVILLNSSRGNVICEDTAYEFLKNKTVSGAWFDVFKEEPYKGKLANLSNVILTPHISSYTKETRIEMEYEAVENLKAFI